MVKNRRALDRTFSDEDLAPSTPEQLEQLRLLRSAEMDSATPCAVLLVGQPTLARQLRMGFAVHGLDHLETIVPAVRSLGRRHAGYGVLASTMLEGMQQRQVELSTPVTAA